MSASITTQVPGKSDSSVLKYLREKYPDKRQIEVTEVIWKWNDYSIPIFAKYSRRACVKALITVTNASVTSENALAYLITRYPERHNIEIIEIVTD